MKNNILFLSIVLTLSLCSSKVNLKRDLELLKTIELNISEPSGITVFKNNLYIVSDHNGTIYKTSLEGEILQKIRTKFNDLEGVTIQNSTHNFWLVNEEKRQLIVLNSLGEILQKIKIKGKQRTKNSGLEGVCFVNNTLYVVNENSPKQLLQLNLEGKITNKFTLDFCKDISGICYEKETNSFWMVSDESQSIYNITKEGLLLKRYKTPVIKAEGIVIYNNKLYVVSDSQSKLYIFKKPV